MAVEIYSFENITSTGLQLNWVLPKTVARLTLCGIALDHTLYIALSASSCNIQFLEVYQCNPSAVQRICDQITLPNLRVFHTDEITAFACLQMPSLEEFHLISSSENALDPFALLQSIAVAVMCCNLKRLILRRSLTPITANIAQSNLRVSYLYFPTGIVKYGYRIKNWRPGTR
jgi:hypothetical protein